jgi:hypothetical protein
MDCIGFLVRYTRWVLVVLASVAPMSSVPFTYSPRPFVGRICFPSLVEIFFISRFLLAYA